MYTLWTDHLKGTEDKQKFVDQIISAKPVLERLKQILESEEQAIDRSEVSVKTFDNPNWAYIQAFKNGSRASYGIIKKLIDLDQQRRSTNDREFA